MAEKINGKTQPTKKAATKSSTKKVTKKIDTTKSSSKKSKNPVVVMDTSMGVMELELYPDKAPITVKNFLDYVKTGFYNELIFHRIIDGFMIQGGGFDGRMDQKEPNTPIQIESDNGLSNDKGTIAMARTQDPNSATCQFFINVADNMFLNFREASVQGYGYTVFGKVIKGIEVADKIAKVKTGNYEYFQDVPVEFIFIKSIKVK